MYDSGINSFENTREKDIFYEVFLNFKNDLIQFR